MVLDYHCIDVVYFSPTTWFIIVNIYDIISLKTMTNCYSRNKRYTNVVRLFHDMIKKGMIPNEVTMSTTIPVCAHLRALDLRKEVHLYLMLLEFDLNVYIGSSWQNSHCSISQIVSHSFIQNIPSTCVVIGFPPLSPL